MSSATPASLQAATTVTGEVERITYENEASGFRVLRLSGVERHGELVVVGVMPAVGAGMRVRVSGRLVRDARHGEQLRADSVVPLEPDTLVGLEKYLGSGAIEGIGPGFAKRIVETFGVDTFKVLDEEPYKLSRVPGLGQRRAAALRDQWAAHRSLGNVMLLLQTHGASPALAARIVERYGERAAAIVQQSPYRLALELRGVGFKTADHLARSLGLAGDHPERVQAGLLHVLGALAEEGHVAIPRAQVLDEACALLGVEAAHVEAGIDACWGSGRVVVESGQVLLAELRAAEQELAEQLVHLRLAPAQHLPGLESAIASFEREARVELGELQRRAIEGVARDKVLVVTGGPGVGKTTIVRAMVSVFDLRGLRVSLAAPTGRAAKRLSEATGRPASTLHRLLEYDPRSGAFERDAEHPLEADAVVVDEVSMLDVQLARALLVAIPPAARLVLVGDVDQLPSVGPGAVLRDILESGVVPSVRLDTIFRQASQSRIVSNAHGILRGVMPTSANADDPGADFFVVPRRDPEQAAVTIRELVVERIPKRFGLSPLTDIQVLTPMHRGAAGTVALNAMLQAALNPHGTALSVRGQSLRAGDKVMQRRNDYEREVFNGDLGFVIGVDPEARTALVRYDDRVVEYDDAGLEQLMVAYATSIHKSQGSEYPAVVMPLLTSHYVMLSRNLVYTGVTRARRLCVLVADTRALALALSEARQEQRSTSLVRRLLEAAAAAPRSDVDP